MRVLSICTGAGGLDLALPPHDLIAVAEHDAAASRVLAARFPDAPNLGDLRTIDWPAFAGSVDVLVGGVPCQPYSNAGNAKGADDDRDLLPTVPRIAGLVGPRLVLLENVAALVRAPEWGYFCGLMADVGYDVRWGVVRASDVGAAHQRARVFAVCEPTDAARERLGGDDSRGLRGVAPGFERLVAVGDGPDGAAADPDRLPGPSATRSGARGDEPGQADGAVAGGSERYAGNDAADTGGSRRGRLGDESGALAGAGRVGFDVLDGYVAVDAGPGEHGPADPDDLDGRGSNDPVLTLFPTPLAEEGGLWPDSSGHGRQLTQVAKMLPTPLAGGPQTADSARVRADTAGPDLVTAVDRLLPTPTTAPGPRVNRDGGDSLGGALLPTPTSTPYGRNRTSTRPDDSAHHDGLTLHDLERLDTWGEYADAVVRHEALIGRPAPEPTIPAAATRNPEPGQVEGLGRRLSPLFVEWLMCWPEGWVTDPALGLSVTQQLKILGNGVVTPQAAFAWWLLDAFAAIEVQV